MRYTFSSTNHPPGTAWVVIIVYEPPTTLYSGWLRPGESYTFTLAPSSASVYATAYDTAYKVLANHNPWGRFTFREGGSYIADFAKRTVLGVEVAPPPAVVGPTEFSIGVSFG